MTSNSYRDQVRASLALLSSSADEQVAFLQRLGVYPLADELALDLHELVLLAPLQVERGALSNEEREALAGVDAQLGSMSGDVHGRLWTPEGLRTATEWSAVRRLAAEALDVFTR